MKTSKILHQLMVFAKAAFMLICFTSNRADAQYSHTIFWMQHIPQAGYANVAMQPQPKWYIGMPALSSYHLGAANTGFAYRDMVSRDQFNERVYDDNKLIRALDNQNQLDLHFSAEWLAFGFAAGPAYVSFSLTEKIGGSFSYSDDFVALMLKGNGYFADQNRPADLSGLGVNMYHYREFSAGYSRQFTDFLTAGVRAKFLFGMSNIWFEKSEFSVNTNPDSYTIRLETDFLVNTSLPFVISPIEDGIDDIDVDPTDYLFNLDNPGFALDLGAVYNPTNNITLAASIVDLGFIRWRSDTENIAGTGGFDFEGLDLNDFFNNGDALDALLDSLENALSYTETTNHYRTTLNPYLFIAGKYELTPAHSFGILSGVRILDDGFRHQLTISYNLKLSHFFGASLGYTIFENNFTNLGAGFYLNAGPLQFYLASDNIFGAMQPHSMQMTNARFGFNWVFGRKARDS